MVRQLPASLQADADAICPTDRTAIVLPAPHPRPAIRYASLFPPFMRST